MNKKLIILSIIIIIIIIVGLCYIYNKENKENNIENNHSLVYFKNDDVNLIVPNDLTHRFTDRINAEKKFRQITKKLMKKGIIDINKNIIDLGAWIGDNSLVWAKMINGSVYAIDPSPNNIDIIKNIQNINNINNIVTIKKPISNKIESVEVSEGDINHGSFKSSDKGIETETLDNLYNSKKINNIGFIHLDVEGFEYKVLEGSQKIISMFRPIIVTESHEGDKEVNPLITKHGYNVYVIDEVCGANPTCRNSLWIPNEITLPEDIINIL